MKVLILEDDPHRNERFEAVCKAGGYEYVLTDTATACIEEMEKHDYDLLFLDHDLGGMAFVDPKFQNTGSGVVRWMVENALDIPTIIHSMNAPAAIRMEQDLHAAHFCMVYRRAWLFLTHELRSVLDEVASQL